MGDPENRIALFGGTFDPIHCGHVRAAEEAVRLFGLTRVVLVPSFLPPHREIDSGTRAEDRFEMVRLACEGNPALEASDFETRRNEKSFSINTVKHFLQNEPPGTQVQFLIGTDAFAEIDAWHKVDELLSICDFLVMVRPGAQASLDEAIPLRLRNDFKPEANGVRRHKSGRGARLVEIRGLEISSTLVRRNIAEGLPWESLVPGPVAGYIRERRLYMTDPAARAKPGP